MFGVKALKMVSEPQGLQRRVVSELRWDVQERGPDLLNSSCHSSFYFGFGFLEMAPVSWLPVRHIALILNLKMNLKQVAPIPWLLFQPLCPAKAMLKTNCFQGWRTTQERRATKLSVLQMTVFPSLVNRGFWLLTHSKEFPWSSQSLHGDRTASVSSSNCTVTNRLRSWTNTCASSWVCTRPFAVNTTVGVLDLFTVSISSGGWLFSYRVHWRSWIDYEFALFWSCRSKCRHCLTFTRSTERSFVRILELVNTFAKSHAVLRTHPSCCQVSSCDLSPNFGAQGLRSWGAHFGMIPPHGLIREFWFGAWCPWRLWRCALLPIFLDHVE